MMSPPPDLAIGQVSDRPIDLVIIGGGINGAGIARDAAGRGLRVALFEKGDLASATSSASTKLIHGGLRYLEHYAFRLVRSSLEERERLLKIAPHIIWPLRFILPHEPGMRPAWLLRLGLFLYDHLGGRKILPATRSLDLTRDAAGLPLQPHLLRGFEYSDLWCEDSRLVVLNARAAARLGATIRTRCAVISARRVTIDNEALWEISTQNTGSVRVEKILARYLINAAGPWAGTVTGDIMGLKVPARIRMVQGSHIVVPRIFDHDRAYIFQNRDGRIVFAIPYEGNFTLIGTTDHDYTGEPGEVAIRDGEINYLCQAVSEYFKVPVTPDQVVWTYSGVRPLYDDGATSAQEATRDYVLHLDAPLGAAPALSVFGGKLTTYRRLAENALEKLAPFLPPSFAEQAGWTMKTPLPGGDFAHDGFEALVARIEAQFPFLPARTARRLARAYGTDSFTILGNAQTLADLGMDFGAGLSAREVDFLIAEEWAVCAQDVLWRRSKLGLRLSAPEQERLAAYARFQPPGA